MSVYQLVGKKVIITLGVVVQRAIEFIGKDELQAVLFTYTLDNFSPILSWTFEKNRHNEMYLLFVK